MTQYEAGAERQTNGTASVIITFQGLIGLMARAEVRRHLARTDAANTPNTPEEEVSE